HSPLEPELAFVLDDAGQAVGYVIGMADTAVRADALWWTASSKPGAAHDAELVDAVADIRLAIAGVAAPHVGMVTANRKARPFYDRLGFHVINVINVADAGPLTYLGLNINDQEPA
ncbi:MAG TPA: hypothetical protein VGD71_42950, partial [Kribbella sp.]